MVQQMQTQAVETESQKRRRIRQDEFELLKEFVLKDAEFMLGASKGTLDTLSQLNKAFAGDTEKEQKKAFERSKKLQKAQALISTYESAVQAYKSLAGIPIVGPVLGVVAAGSAVALGLANVKKIDSQKFTSPSASAGGGGSAPTSTATAPTTQAPQLDLSFLGEGAGQEEPIQAYVVAQDVSNAQQANQQIQDQATL